MRQKIQDQQCVYRMTEVSSFAETSAIDLRRARSEQAPALRMAFSPASQGHSAAVEQVPTAVAFSSVCNGVRAEGRPPATVGGRCQDNTPGGDDVREWMGSNRDRLWFPRRTRRTRVSNKFSFCPASQGKVAVVEPVPAATTSYAAADRLGRADIVDTFPGGGAR